MTLLNNKNTIILVLIFMAVYSKSNAQNIPDGEGSVLWKIKHPKTDKISYLLGSVHTYGSKWIESYKVIDSLVSKQDIFLCENTFSIDSLKKNNFTRFTFEAKADRNLFEDDLELIRTHFLKTTDIDVGELLDSAKKSDSFIYSIYYILLYQLAEKNNLKVSPDFVPMDDILLQKAFKEEKKCYGLDNMQTLNKVLSAKKNIKSLKRTIVDLVKDLELIELPPERKREFAKYISMMNYYNKGKFIFDSHSISDDGVKAVTRNKSWMNVLPAFIMDKNCFITVGIIHLNGKKGILQLLENQGFEISEVELK